MYTTTSLLTACLLAGGALPFTFPAQQPGQGTPKTTGEGDSIRMGLRLDAGVTHRFEVSESQPSTARTGGLGENPRDVRPGQTGDVQDGNPGEGLGQQPGTGQRTWPQTQAGPVHLVRYEIQVRDVGEGGQDVTTLVVKKTQRGGGMSAQPLGRDRDRDREPQDDRGRVGDLDREREPLDLGSEEKTFIVEVTRKGEIRQIRLDDRDKNKNKDFDKDKPGQPADERGAHRLPGQEGGLVGMTEWNGDPTVKVRDHLHAILGTGLHERELRTGEIVYIGDAGTSSRPVEAGSGRGLRNPGQTGTDQRPSRVGEQDKDSHAIGQGTMHKEAPVHLTGVALEFQAVERMGQHRIARFRILDEPLGLHGRRTDQQPGARSADKPSELPRRETGQPTGLNDTDTEGGIASYRVEDGLLEQLTFLARVEDPLRTTDKHPVGDRPVGDRPEGERPGSVGRQDRDPVTAGVDAMLNRHSITIRRIGG